ncbi:MAG: hypothetical protein GXO97_06745 [Nitrospirae bacterium]|nr:hypothetical protein [Nitrospirota bacterium]
MRIFVFEFKTTLILLLLFCATVFAQNDNKGVAFIKIVQPEGGEILQEGQTLQIRWKSEAVERVYISVAVGGKDRGLIGDAEPVDALRGEYIWRIPEGFITGFGISESKNVRVMILDAKDGSVRDISRPFSITGSGTRGLIRYNREDVYAEAIVRYFLALSKRRFKDAYDMLSPCRIILYNPDGSALAFQARTDYEKWLKEQKTIEDIRLVEIKRLTMDRDNALILLGIRRYEVDVEMKFYKDSTWTLGSGRHGFVVTVAKGTDKKIRILDISVAP